MPIAQLTQKITHILRAILLRPIRVVQMPHRSISPTGRMIQAQLARYATIGDLRKLLPHLILSVLQAFTAARRHIVDLIGQLDQQIYVCLPDALQKRGQRVYARTLGHHIESLLAANGRGHMRSIYVAQAILSCRRQMDAIVVVGQKIRVQVPRAVLVLQGAFVASVLLAFRNALEFDVELRIGEFRFENLALLQIGKILLGYVKFVKRRAVHSPISLY